MFHANKNTYPILNLLSASVDAAGDVMVEMEMELAFSSADEFAVVVAVVCGPFVVVGGVGDELPWPMSGRERRRR